MQWLQLTDKLSKTEDNLRNKYHNNSKSSYFVIKEIGDGANGDNGVVCENMVSHIFPRMICN